MGWVRYARWPLRALTRRSPPPAALAASPIGAPLAGSGLGGLPVDTAPRADGLCVAAAHHPGERHQRRPGDANALGGEVAERRLGLRPLLGPRVAVGVEEGREAEVVVGQAVGTEAGHELLDAAVLAAGHVGLGGRVVREGVRQDARELHLVQPLARAVAIAR